MSLSTAPISVVIPCLNAERTLAEALESVFAQTARPLEVLLVDDKSTDRSIEIARSFGPKVRILQNPKCSTGAARRLGVEEAHGEYVAFMDADDVILPTKNERQLAILESSDPYTVVHTGSVLFWEDGSRPERMRSGGDLAVGRCTRVIFERNPVCGASTMISKALALELGNYNADLRGTDDFGLSLVASVFCDLVYVPEPLYRIRQHSANMTRRRARMAYYHWLAQDYFRQRCPRAFAALPAESIRDFMTGPVVRAVREAYWARCGDGYHQILKLAMELAPHEPDLREFWQRRWLPMRALRAWDKCTSLLRTARPEVS